MREKWERADYRELTIGNAITSCRDFYQPGAEKPPPHGDEDAPPGVLGGGPGTETGAKRVAHSAQTPTGPPPEAGRVPEPGT